MFLEQRHKILMWIDVQKWARILLINIPCLQEPGNEGDLDLTIVEVVGRAYCMGVDSLGASGFVFVLWHMIVAELHFKWIVVRDSWFVQFRVDWDCCTGLDTWLW